MELKDIKELIEIVGTSNISEIELESDGFKLKVTKEIDSLNNTMSKQSQDMVVEKEPVEVDLVPESEQEDDNLVTLTAPMVGTFYGAPSPTSEPFVQEGEKIREGQSLCIIEAMKLMNEIESEYSGILREILVENGQPVEYGQPLFKLELLG